MKVQFLCALSVTEVDDNTWRLEAPFLAKVDADTIKVPTGFITDFASVPRLPLAYSLFGDKAHRAAVLHDYLYSLGLCSREYADNVLKAAMEADGLGWFTRNMMWAGVRLFGGSHFTSKK